MLYNARRQFRAATCCLPFLAACSATGPLFPATRVVEQSKAEVVIYRPSFSLGSASSLRVTVDEVEYGSLKNGGWLSLAVPPGQRVVKVIQFDIFDRVSSVSLNAEQGKTVFVRVLPGSFRVVAPAVPVIGTRPVEVVSEEVALKDLSTLKESR